MPEVGAAIAILTNSDRAAAGVFADILCPWSEAMPGDPARELCRQMRSFRNVQLGIAAMLFVGFLTYALSRLRRLRRRRLRLAWRLTPMRAARLIALSAVVVAWWVLWYTDTLLTAIGYAPTFVTVRLNPWPTAFVWVSWSVTLLLVAFAASAFTVENEPTPAGSG